jgi:hypothetical protein
MKIWRRIATAIVCGAVSFGAGAQTIGNQTARYNTSFTSGNPAQASTLIDFSHPATVAGQMTTATFRWTTSNCTGAAKIKFLRRNASLDLGTFTITERGPFDVTGPINTVTLNPPVDVQPGDYIGITQLRGQARGGHCGATALADTTHDQILLFGNGDVQSGSFSAFRQHHGYEMNVIASTSPDIVSGVIAAVGALPGQNNSFFRTSVQVTNPANVAISGKLVFHPAGQQASPSDPSLPFVLQAFETKSNADIVTAMGRSGLGTMDVVTTSSLPAVVIARVYNDQGANGTAGFTEEAFRPSQALRMPEQAVLAVPADLTKFRYNVGVRTLGQGVSLRMNIVEPSGEQHVFERSYPANYFSQMPGAEFIGHPLAGGSTIFISVLQGSAFIYGGTTDNKTNDGNIQFAARR